mgnify:CR=1 FL=1
MIEEEEQAEKVEPPAQKTEKKRELQEELKLARAAYKMAHLADVKARAGLAHIIGRRSLDEVRREDGNAVLRGSITE